MHVGGSRRAGLAPERDAQVVGVDPGLERPLEHAVRARRQSRPVRGQVLEQLADVPAVDQQDAPLLVGEPVQQPVQIVPGGGGGEHGVTEAFGWGRLLGGPEPGGGSGQPLGLGPAGGAGLQVGADLGGRLRPEGPAA